MTIQQAAFEMCRHIRTSPQTEPLRKLLTTPSDPMEDRPSFVMNQGGTLNHQFFGYLFVDEELPQLFGQLPPALLGQRLSQEEHSLLMWAHCEIQSINRLCLKPLIDVDLSYFAITTPYNDLESSISCPADPPKWVTGPPLADLLEAFANHPARVLALETLPAIASASISEVDLTRAVLRLSTELKNAGPMEAPEGFMQAIFHPPNEDLARAVLFHVGSLVSLRASLSSLNQLLFQAALYDTLPTFSSDNLIDIQGPTRHAAGSGTTVLCQPHDKLRGLSAASIFYFDSPFDDEMRKALTSGLFRAQGFTLKMSQENGTTFGFPLWKLDDHLCPYSFVQAWTSKS